MPFSSLFPIAGQRVRTSLCLVIATRVFFTALISGLYLRFPVSMVPQGFHEAIGLLDNVIVLLICLVLIATICRDLRAWAVRGVQSTSTLKQQIS